MLTLEKAKELLDTTTTQEHLVLHAKNVMAAMSGMAKHFGEDEAHWMAIGYLHDYDYEQHPEEHLQYTAEPLRAAGLEDLHMGFESGSDFILTLMNKGVSSLDVLAAARKMEKADIGYFVTVILGLGGRTYRNIHALETARVLSQMNPKGIWCLNLKVWENTPLEQMAKQGEFDPMTPWEMLQEEWIMLNNLNVKNCFYMDTTALNKYTVQGILPQAKPALLEGIRQLLEQERP